jgi:dipeptidase
MGECTCSVRAGKTDRDREAVPFENRNLARVAMERCSTAREAIKLMGQLAEKYGYNKSGETITIIDTEETWVFNILCTQSGKGAILVSQRMLDAEIAVTANTFTIRVIDLDNPDYFMALDNFFRNMSSTLKYSYKFKK